MTSIVVGKDRISLIESERYVAGTQNVYLMKVSFSEDWEGLEKKLVFRTDEFEMAVEIITCSEQFPIPSEIFYRPSNKLQVGCYASKCGETTLNTRWLSLGRIVKGTLNTDCNCGCQPPSKPSPDTYKVLRELIDRKADRLTFEDGQFILWAGDDPLSSFDAPIALPSGGSAGQLLAKASDEEGDYEWKTVTTDLSLRLPLGSIQIWSGSIDSIPEGFSLCDGQNGTQDLRAAMIVGASDSIEPGTVFDDQPTPMNLEAPDTPSEPTEPAEHPPIRYYALAFIQKTSLTELDKKQGQNAYDIAVENGFEGTEEEWLKSLNGKSAYEIAVENGFTGTEEEWIDQLETSGTPVVKSLTISSKAEIPEPGFGAFIFDDTTVSVKQAAKSRAKANILSFAHNYVYVNADDATKLVITTLDNKVYECGLNDAGEIISIEEVVISGEGGEGIQGPKGDPGDSAYQVAVKNGFTGTEVEWLASLKGADGKSAYQIAVDNGFTGTEEEWLESLKGSGTVTDPDVIPVLKGKDIRTKDGLTENGLMGKTATLHVVNVTFGNGQTINFKNDYIYFEATDGYFAVMTLDGVKAVYRYDESGNMLWDKFVNAYDKTAESITYDDTGTNLGATTVQDAIVKLDEAVKGNTFTKTIEGKVIKTKEQLTEVGLWPMFVGTVRMKDVVFVEGVNRIVNFGDDFVYIESWNQKSTVVLYTLKGNRITLAFDESDNIVKQSIDDSYAGDGSGSGTPGADGKSAYEIAVANGFNGTETEWLASLKGADGKDGKSAYQIAVENGYEGSEEQWIAEIQNRTAEDISYDDSTTNLGATTIQEAIAKLDEAVKADTPVKTIKSEVITTRDRAAALGLVPYAGTIRAINTTFGSVGNIVFSDDYIYIKTSNSVFYVYTIDGVRTQFTYDDAGAFIRQSRDDAYASGSGSGTPGEDGKSAYQIAVENGFQGSEEDWLASLVGPAGADGTDGTNGTDGKSAYQLAVEAGFNGSEAEWLASLKGTNGDPGPEGTSAYQLAVDKGFTGTEEEWLASLKGIQGEAGTNGKSAYQLAQDAGFTGTEEEWLASLKGATGAKGKSAYQLAVDAGFEGDETAWLASLKGDPGPAGADGKSTYDIAVEQGFTGTEAEWLETAKGPKGDNGKSAYEVAVENGYEGSVNQWLESLKGEGIAEFITYADQTITSRDVLVSIDVSKVAHFERCKFAAADGNSVTLNDELVFIEPSDLSLKAYRANGETIDLAFGEDEVFTTLAVSKGESISDLFVPITDEQIESLFV